MKFVMIHKYNTVLLKEISERNDIILGLAFSFDHSDHNFEDAIRLVHLDLWFYQGHRMKLLGCDIVEGPFLGHIHLLTKSAYNPKSSSSWGWQGSSWYIEIYPPDCCIFDGDTCTGWKALRWWLNRFNKNSLWDVGFLPLNSTVNSSMLESCGR